MKTALVIGNASAVCTGPKGPVPLNAPNLVTCKPDTTIGIEGEKIAWIRQGTESPSPQGPTILDARGGCVIPGLIDCHTHTVFAGTREVEFVQRIDGKSYVEIAEAGGGIRATVEAVRRATVDELVELALPRLRRMLEWGVTTVEIKTGYGLTTSDELKMLNAIEILRRRQPIELVSTYLAAHTIPAEYAGRPDAYLDEVLAASALEQAAQRSAEFADVFCERSAFDVFQSRRVLQTCKRFNMTPRIHADQITQMGASKLAAEVGASSADHLEQIDEQSIQALKSAGTIAVLLPACSFYLGVAQAPAARIISAGVPVAVATDFNPGSSVVDSLPLTMSIACTQMRLTPRQALAATTSNAAAVLRRQDRVGAIAPGMQADLTILNVPNIEQMCYFTGRNCTRAVIKKGRLVFSKQ